MLILITYFLFLLDVIWVILCVDEGGILGLTQQLSSLGREMVSHQGSNPTSPSNPFGLSTPIGTSPQPIYSVPHNSPANGVVHVSPARRSLFHSRVREMNTVLKLIVNGLNYCLLKDYHLSVSDWSEGLFRVTSTYFLTARDHQSRDWGEVRRWYKVFASPHSLHVLH